MLHSFQSIADVMLEHQWPFHVLCIFSILLIRIFRLRTFLELTLPITVLYIVAIGNAVTVEFLLTAHGGALTQPTTAGLKALALVSVLVYGSIASNLVVFAVTHDKPSA